MSELRSILQQWSLLEAAGKTAALATVVEVTGSAFRRAGARMLIAEDGHVTGGVSGGCLESDVIEHALLMRFTGKPILIEYDTRRDDPVLGIGTGCHGIIRILIEPMTPRAGAEAGMTPLHWIEQLHAKRQNGVLITCVAVEKVESTHMTSIERAIWRHDDFFESSMADPELRTVVSKEARLTMNEQRSRSASLPGREMRVFLEYLPTPIALVIFGAGHDAIPLARIAAGLGWHVSLVDHRPAWASTQRFPGVDSILVASAGDLDGKLLLDDRTAAVVMTHHYQHDLDWIANLLPSPVGYIGILGSRDRTRRLWQDTLARGLPEAARMEGRVFGPVGLDIGAEGPDEIALAIAAEIQAVFKSRAAESIAPLSRQHPAEREPREPGGNKLLNAM